MITYLYSLQKKLCMALESFEPAVRFLQEDWQRENVGSGKTCVLEKGDIFEKAGVNFSRVAGNALPEAATRQHLSLANAPFEAMGVSVVIHPCNPFVPTAHMNVRYFQAKNKAGDTVWWFGGGYDLTPYYGFEEDAIHWHRIAKKTCDVFDDTLYPQFKKNADDYFYLKHRNEPRGIGGLFFDDFNQLGYEKCFAFVQAVGNSFSDAYLPIVEKRQNTPYTPAHRDFQCYRRGRYVEFNLLQDRGTLFGLKFGGRTESILMSLPPVTHWRYAHQHPLSPEEAELMMFLAPRKWV